jgi:hypothetical protein
MRPTLAVLALLAALAVPSDEPTRLAERAGTAWLAAIAPAAGSEIRLLDLGIGLAPAPDRSPGARLADVFDDPEAGPAILRRWGATLALAGGMLAGLAVGLILGRQRKPAPMRDSEAVAAAEAPSPGSDASSRPAANTLAQALAALDMMEIEARTSFRHLAHTIASLAEEARVSPLGSRAPAARAEEARSSLASAAGALAASRETFDRQRRDAAAVHGLAKDVLARVQDAVAAAEGMDGSFQTLVAAAETIAWLPRLFDELELRAGGGAGGGGDALALAFARARRIALARIADLDKARGALMEGIVVVEENLVALDDAGRRLLEHAASAVGREADAASLDDLEARLREAGAALDATRDLLAPVDAHAERFATRAGEAERIVTEALGRLETILGRLVREEDRRKFQRIATRLPVRVLIEDAWSEGEVIDLSMGGAAIAGELPCRPGADGQIAFRDWDTMLPFVVTGVSGGRTHLCFRLNEGLARGLIGYVETLLAA